MEEKKDNEKRVYDNLIELVKDLVPQSPLIRLMNDANYYFKPSRSYELIGFGNKVLAMGNLWDIRSFRGESKEHDSCEASIYRNNKHDGTYDSEAIVIDEIRCLEFENIIKTFPQVKAAISDSANVDYMALAQHYGLNTKMVDVSYSIETAVYFATHRLNNDIMEPVGDDIGCLRMFFDLAFINQEDITTGKLHYVGLQCFKRPGLQGAMGIETEFGEDLSKQCTTYYFKQNLEISNRIHANYHRDEDNRITERSILFPEEEVCDIAEIVKKTESLSEKAVRDYCILNNQNYDKIVGVLNKRGIALQSCPVYELSDDRILELEKEYEGSPYGDVQLFSRLMRLE